MAKEVTNKSSVDSIPTAWRPSAEMRRIGASLLDQQFFCWGEDIKNTEGNLLLEYGMQRERPAVATTPCSRYTLGLSSGRRLTLWGFGLCLWDRDRGGLFLPRSRFAPQQLAADADPTDVWTVHDSLATCSTSADSARLSVLVAEVFSIIADYEEFVPRSRGTRWRESIVQRWWKRTVPAAEIAPTWHRYAAECTSDSTDCPLTSLTSASML
jgi:hypothetical protein